MSKKPDSFWVSDKIRICPFFGCLKSAFVRILNTCLKKYIQWIAEFRTEVSSDFSTKLNSFESKFFIKRSRLVRILGKKCLGMDLKSPVWILNQFGIQTFTVIDLKLGLQGPPHLGDKVEPCNLKNESMIFIYIEPSGNT